MTADVNGAVEHADQAWSNAPLGSTRQSRP